MLPQWAVLAVNVVFYAYLPWLCVIFLREARGAERVLVAGWLPGILLSPVQRWVSMSVSSAIRYVQAVSIAIALLAAIHLFLRTPASPGPQHDSSISG
jgi:uncharacterized membrane protein